MRDAQLTDLVVSALVETLRVERCRREAGMAMMREVLRANRLHEWEEMEEGLMGEDNNDVWDWDGNNDN